MSGNLVQLREMRPPDRAAALQLIGELIMHEAGLDPAQSPFVEDRVSSAAEAANYLLYCETRISAGNGEVVVAELEGAIVGFMCWVISEDGPFVQAGLRRIGEVVYVVVSGRHRGRGIGAALMGHAEKLTRDANLKRLSLHVMAGNRQAVGVYEKLGYKTRAFKMLKKIG